MSDNHAQFLNSFEMNIIHNLPDWFPGKPNKTKRKIKE